MVGSVDAPCPQRTDNNGEEEMLLDTRKVAIEKIEGWDDAVVVN